VNYCSFVQGTICGKNKNFFLSRICTKSTLEYQLQNRDMRSFLVFHEGSCPIEVLDIAWKNVPWMRVTLFHRLTFEQAAQTMLPGKYNLIVLCNPWGPGSAEETDWWTSWNIFWRLWIVWKLLFPAMFHFLWRSRLSGK